MAEIFKPSYTVTDKATGKKLTKKSKTWHVRYYSPDGQRHRVKGYRDRKATEALAAELERRAIRRDAGILDVADDHARRPLREHAEDYRAYLRDKGNTGDYVEKTYNRLLAVLDGCRFVRLADVLPSRVLTFLAELQKTGRKPNSKKKNLQKHRRCGVTSANYHLAAVKGFTRWLWKDGRTGVDPLAGMSRLSGAEADVKHKRRDFTEDELRKLLTVTRQSDRTFRGLTGEDRYHLYLVACKTGYRASELHSMTPASFRLDDNPPQVVVKAGYTKNGQEAAQPVQPDVAEELRHYLSGKAADMQVWPGTWNVAAFLMIQKDEAEAGITYETADGFADFHSLRHTYISLVGRLGTSPKVHQELARHSTYALTERYTHTRMKEKALAVGGLPRLSMHGEKNLSPNLALRQDVSGDELRQTEAENGKAVEGEEVRETAEKPPELRLSCGAEETYPAWIRTRNEGTKIPSAVPTTDCRLRIYDDASEPLAQTLPCNLPNDADLLMLMQRWPTLPEAVKAGIVALANATGDTPRKVA